jgi:hypothetical protein
VREDEGESGCESGREDEQEGVRCGEDEEDEIRAAVPQGTDVSGFIRPSEKILAYNYGVWLLWIVPQLNEHLDVSSLRALQSGDVGQRGYQNTSRRQLPLPPCLHSSNLSIRRRAFRSQISATGMTNPPRYIQKVPPPCSTLTPTTHQTLPSQQPCRHKSNRI